MPLLKWNAKAKAKLKAELLAWISLGNTIAEFCRKHEVSRRTLYDWKDEDAEYAAEFARAKDEGFDALAEQALLIAHTFEYGDETTEGFDGDSTMMRKTRRELLGQRRFKFDAIMKLLAKWDPKRYGEKLGVEHSVDESTAERMSRALKRDGD